MGCFSGTRNHPSSGGLLHRLNYYDDEASVGEIADNENRLLMETYLNAIEAVPHCTVRTGNVRMGRRGKGQQRLEQKGVDVLMAVEMLADAQAGHLSFALLLTGNADMVPAVDEVRRHGVTVVVIASDGLASELREAADEVWRLDVAAFENWGFR